MRAAVAGLLCLLLGLAGSVPGASGADEQREPSVEEVLRQVVPYTSTWDAVAQDIASLTTYTEGLQGASQQYTSWAAVLRPRLVQLQGSVTALTQQVATLTAEAGSISVELAAQQALRQTQEREVGLLARLLYQQPSPELTAIAQMLDGEDLRSFERQNLVTSVLESNTAELHRIIAIVNQLVADLQAKNEELARTSEQLASETVQRDRVAARTQLVDTGLKQIQADSDRAQAVIDEIRRAEAAAIAAAAAAAAAAEAEAAARAKAEAEAQAAAVAAGRATSMGPTGTARPTGGGEPAQSSENFSARLPQNIPYREAFLTYGLRYKVEPALLAAIAAQESGFNAWAGCDRAGAGKGIMQHENRVEYCGPDAVPASIELSAKMLARYYNNTGSWTAAVFGYNNGPGLMHVWVEHSDDIDALVAALTTYYDRQSYASPGPMDGYPSWGAWRARVAFSYAAPNPLPGFRSATQKWLIYRQG